MSPLNALSFLYILIKIISIKAELPELTDYVTLHGDSNDESTNKILAKLNEIERKVEAVEDRVKGITNVETINIQKLIDRSVNERETQQSLMRIQQKVEDLNMVQRDMKIEIVLLRENMNLIANGLRGLSDLEHKLSANLEHYVSVEKNKTIENFNSKCDGVKEMISEYYQLSNGSLNKILTKFESVEKNLVSNDIFADVGLRKINSTINTIANSLTRTYDNCKAAVRINGVSGVYKLRVPQTDFDAFSAYCLLDSVDYSSVWTVIQRRQDGTVDFYRNWDAYKHGFGDPSGEYWIGLEKIHALTSKKPHKLWIELEDFSGNKRHARYSHFEIGSESEQYYLKETGDYSGDAGNSFVKGDVPRKFTTPDVDNDIESQNCAVRSSGAWWFSDCSFSVLNGEYNNTKNGRGINWYAWHGYEYSLKSSTMYIRPVD